MTKRMFIMLGCVIALIAALAFGFYLHIQKMIASSPKPGPQTVTTAKVEALEWQPQLAAVGTLTAVRGVDLSPEIVGMVREVRFHSGQDVKAGEVLIELNADSDIALLHSAQAAADLAAVVLARDTAQLAIRAVSQAQVDADAADLKVKRAQVEQQAATVAKKTIRAPFAGRLGITTINPGQFLNPGDRIVTLQRIDPIYIDFYLPQKQVGRLAAGMSVEIVSDAFPGQSFGGKITSISPKVDVATRNVQVQATIANPRRQLLPGMFARASVQSGAPKRVLTLPQTTITYNPYGATVFILKPADKKDGKDAAGKAGLVAQQVFVTTGETRGDQVAILKGLEEGQQVVSSGQLKLKNGTPVVVDNSVLPANSPNPTPQEH